MPDVDAILSRFASRSEEVKSKPPEPRKTPEPPLRIAKRGPTDPEQCRILLGAARIAEEIAAEMNRESAEHISLIVLARFAKSMVVA